MKERIANYLKIIEAITEEVKSYSAQIEALNITAESEIEDVTEHYVLTQYLTLLSVDLNKYVTKLIECYECSLVLKEPTEFTEEEETLLKKYISISPMLFTLQGKKVVSKDKDLLKFLQEKAKTQEEKILNYKKSII